MSAPRRRIEVRHSEDCRHLGFVFLGEFKGWPVYMWRDRRGAKRGGLYRWLVTHCNYPECPAVMLVSAEDLEELINDG